MDGGDSPASPRKSRIPRSAGIWRTHTPPATTRGGDFANRHFSALPAFPPARPLWFCPTAAKISVGPASCRRPRSACWTGFILACASCICSLRRKDCGPKRAEESLPATHRRRQVAALAGSARQVLATLRAIGQEAAWSVRNNVLGRLIRYLHTCEVSDQLCAALCARGALHERRGRIGC